MTKVVIDASALIAFIKKEPGAEILTEILPHAHMSTINYTEVATVLLALGMPEDLIEVTLAELIGEIIPFTQPHALLTASLRQTTKDKGLSLGDRACLALGMLYQVPIYTADKIWGRLHLENAEIKLIR